MYLNVYEFCPKSNENDLKKLLNVHAIKVYSLQTRLLVIEYSDSSVAASLHSSGGSVHLRCRSKPSSQMPDVFNCHKMMSLEVGFELGE
jgi:hypothetical protein